jgi:hypothetical protein
VAACKQYGTWVVSLNPLDIRSCSVMLLRTRITKTPSKIYYLNPSEDFEHEADGELSKSREPTEEPDL